MTKKKAETMHPVRGIGVVVALAMDSLAGKGTIGDIHEAVRDRATAREWQTWSETSIRAAIRSALKPKDGTLSEFYAIGGEYKALSLFSVEEYEVKGRELARLSAHNSDKVRELSKACFVAHGRTFDADAILKQAGVA